VTARLERRFRAQRGDRHADRWAVTLDGDELFYCGWQRARRVTRFLNEWQPSDDELARFLSWSTPEARDYLTGLRRITLRWPAVCARCNQPIPAGARATWDPTSRLVLHGARCPLELHANDDAGDEPAEGGHEHEARDQAQR